MACGHLRTAGLDAAAAESLPRDHPLRALGNAVLSPGPVWLTAEALRRALRAAAENGRRLREGRPLLHRVA